MARTRKPRTGTAPQTLQVVLPGTPDEPAEEATTPDEEALDEILAQLPENTVAKIYRIREDGQKEYVIQTTPQAATEERCAKAGPGTYRIIFWGPLGNGAKKGFKGQRTVFVGADAAATAGVTPVSPNGTMFDQTMNAMLVNMINAQASQQREHSTAMMALLTRLGQQPDRDPLLGDLIRAQLAAPKADPIEQATKIVALNPPAAKSGAADILATLDLVDRIRGDGGGGSREGGGRSSWLEDIAKAVIPEVVKHLRPGEVSAGSEQPAPVATAETPGPKLVREIPAVSIPIPAPVVASYLAPVASYLADLAFMAKRGWTPDATADMLLERVSEEELPLIGPLLAAPTLTADIIAAEPSLQHHAAWLEQLKVAIRAALADEEAQAEEGTA